MSKVDGRKIPHVVREKIRFEAIADWKKGIGPTALARKYGTSTKIVHAWINRYKDGGDDGLKTRQGKGGSKPKLSPEQQEQLCLLLRTKTPQDYGYDTALWTCPIIAALILQTFAIRYASSSVYCLLKRMGFSSQKPRWGAWQQDQKK